MLALTLPLPLALALTLPLHATLALPAGDFVPPAAYCQSTALHRGGGATCNAGPIHAMQALFMQCRPYSCP